MGRRSSFSFSISEREYLGLTGNEPDLSQGWCSRDQRPTRHLESQTVLENTRTSLELALLVLHSGQMPPKSTQHVTR